jgi:hypothetical protein
MFPTAADGLEELGRAETPIASTGKPSGERPAASSATSADARSVRLARMPAGPMAAPADDDVRRSGTLGPEPDAGLAGPLVEILEHFEADRGQPGGWAAPDGPVPPYPAGLHEIFTLCCDVGATLGLRADDRLVRGHSAPF